MPRRDPRYNKRQKKGVSTPFGTSPISFVIWNSGSNSESRSSSKHGRVRGSIKPQPHRGILRISRNNPAIIFQMSFGRFCRSLGQSNTRTCVHSMKKDGEEQEASLAVRFPEPALSLLDRVIPQQPIFPYHELRTV